MPCAEISARHFGKCAISWADKKTDGAASLAVDGNGGYGPCWCRDRNDCTVGMVSLMLCESWQHCLIPRAAHWLGLLSRHPPGGVLALPHPRVRGAGWELSLCPGLPETGAQVGWDGGKGGGRICSHGKPHPDRWPHQNRFWWLTPTHWNSISTWDRPSLSMPPFMVVWETRGIWQSPTWTSGLVFSNRVMIICEVCWAHEAALWVQPGPQNSLVLPACLPNSPSVEGTLLLCRPEALPNFVFPYIHLQAPQDCLSLSKQMLFKLFFHQTIQIVS